MTKLYYWKEGGQNIGHSALDISFGDVPSKTEYVSFWPTNANDWKKDGMNLRLPHNFKQDSKMEGGAPESLEISCLDEDRMRTMWRKVKNTYDYNFLLENCSTLVMQILCEGGATLAYAVNNFACRQIVWTPGTTWILGKMINAKATVILRQRKLGFKPETPGLLDFTGY